MAVLNIRVDDDVRDQLKGMADDKGVTLSEHVRDLLMESLVPVFDRGAGYGDEPAPESMPLIDRQVLSLLHRILARVLPEDSNDADGDEGDQLIRAKILESGFTREYWLETAGFETELSTRECDRVSDILEMFRILTFSFDRLAREDAEIDSDLRHDLEFQGFDHNDALEGHMARYVKFQMDDDKWEELKPQVARHDNGNSHRRMLSIYLRMLAEYRRIMDGRKRGFRSGDYLLSLDELQGIADARTHPSNR